MYDPLFFFELPEQSGSRQRREQGKLGKLHSRLLNETQRLAKHVQRVVFKTENERPPNFNPGGVNATNIAEILIRPVDALSSVANTLIRKCLETDKHSITTALPSQPHEFLVSGEIDGDLGSPTQLEWSESFEKLFGSSWHSD